MTFVFDPIDTPSIAISGSDARFPVRRIFCVGKNYAAHAIEMGGDPTKEDPIFFMKPADVVMPSGSAIPYPPETENFHHEVELVIALGKPGFNLSEVQSRDLIWGYGVGIDLTRRDLQKQAKEKGRPWTWSKGFDYSAPIGALTEKSDGVPLDKGRISLSVNGDIRQDSDISEMTWDVDDIIMRISRSMHLMPGDLIFTGTPQGVGPLQVGDSVRAEIDGLEPLNITITEREI